jgi:ribosome-associated translation inhibitor RaiA
VVVVVVLQTKSTRRRAEDRLARLETYIKALSGVSWSLRQSTMSNYKLVVVKEV